MCISEITRANSVIFYNTRVFLHFLVLSKIVNV